MIYANEEDIRWFGWDGMDIGNRTCKEDNMGRWRDIQTLSDIGHDRKDWYG